MSYKKLLQKYIKHVVDCEGSDFLLKANELYSNVKFTNEELVELEFLGEGSNET